MFIGFFFALNVSLSVPVQANARSCSLEGFQDLCAKIPQTSEPFIKIADGSQFRNPRRPQGPGAETSASDKERGRARLQQKFDWVKSKMISEILAGRTLSQMTQDQKMFISRLRDLRLSIKSEGCTEAPSGHYSAPANEIEVCAEMGLQSPAQLTWLLAHEAGHAIDGCNCQHARMRRNQPLVSNAQHPVASSSRPIFDEINRGSSFLLDPGEIRPDLMAIVRQAERTGHVVRVDGGMDPSHHPLNSVLNCMVRKDILAKGLDVPPRGERCRQIGSFSETPSDIWGARIAGLALKESSPAGDLEKLASLSQESIDLMCAPRTGPKAPRPLNDSFWQSQLPAEGRYIGDRYRDEAIFLTDPNIQAALGCKPNPRMGTCMAQFPSAMRAWGAGTSNKAPSSTASPATR